MPVNWYVCVWRLNHRKVSCYQLSKFYLARLIVYVCKVNVLCILWECAVHIFRPFDNDKVARVGDYLLPVKHLEFVCAFEAIGVYVYESLPLSPWRAKWVYFFYHKCGAHHHLVHAELSCERLREGCLPCA